MAANKEKRRRRSQGKAASAVRRKLREAKHPPKPTPQTDEEIRKARMVVLRELGFSSYIEYLQSDLWATIRAKALEGVTECRVCFRKPTVVHHLGYGKATMRGEKLTPLIPLCHKCHYRVEFKDGVKRSFKDAYSYILRLFKIKKQQIRRREGETR